MKFDEIIEIARTKLVGLQLSSDVYSKRLEFEISQIHIQGAERVWESIVNDKKIFKSNPNNLILPWLLDIIEDKSDPIANREVVPTSSDYHYVKDLIDKYGKLHDIYLDSDKPDIDLDCLPEARDQIKAYAADRYGIGKVASVGTWQTYLFKNAIADVYSALGLNYSELDSQYLHIGAKKEIGKSLAIGLTTLLPDDVNELSRNGTAICRATVNENGVEKECGCEYDDIYCPKCSKDVRDNPTLKSLLEEIEPLRLFYNLSPEHANVVHQATRLIGCIKTSGKHAGAIIIADRDLLGNVPMLYDNSSDQWVSLWTEGRNTQLSKFGYNKWDILGLKNLLYVYKCCEMINENYGISFGDNLCGLEQVDPEKGIGGVYWDGGVEKVMDLNDPQIYQLASECKTQAVFQFDTPLAQSVLNYGVYDFNDLLACNILTHPGPLACCSSYSKIDLEDNSYKPISELNGEPIKFLTSYNEIAYTTDYKNLKSNDKQLYKVELEDGRTLELSEDHRIMTERGYIRVGDLDVEHDVVMIDDKIY